MKRFSLKCPKIDKKTLSGEQAATENVVSLERSIQNQDCEKLEETEKIISEKEVGTVELI